MHPNRINLRDITTEDCSLITHWKDELYMREMSTGVKSLITVEQQMKDIERSIQNKDHYKIIVLHDNNQPIGYIRTNWIDEHQQFAWLRFGLGELRGNGYMKEALLVFIQSLFNDGVHRIEAEVYSFNTPSLNLLESIGFQIEGKKREATTLYNNYFDVYVLGLLKSEFRTEG